MLLIKTDAVLNNPNLPKYTLTQIDRDFALLNPAVWLEAGDSYIQQSSDGLWVNGWVNRATGTTYIPARTDAPQAIVSGGSKIVRFGYMANNPVSTVTFSKSGILKPARVDEVGRLKPTFTFAAIVRIPKPKSASDSWLKAPTDAFSGGTLFGTNASTQTASTFLNFSTTAAENAALTMAVGGGNALLTGRHGAFNDQLWHTLIISTDVASNTTQLWIDGVLKTTGVAPAPSVDQSNMQIMIGCIQADYSLPFVGDVAAFMYIPSIAVHTSSSKLATVKTKLDSIMVQLV